MNKKLPEYYCEIVKINIRKCKDELKWTIPQMAEYTNISEGYLGNILSLKSKKVPTIYMLGQICEATGWDIKDFFKETKIN